MKLWLEGNQRCCDRETAIELGGSEYRNPDIKTILHFDEYVNVPLVGYRLGQIKNGK